MTGLRSYKAGHAAEEAVARHYQRSGRSIAASRWRCPWGEIDLIARDGDEVIFIEVKQSRTHDEALSHLSHRQIERITTAAAVFVDDEPQGQMTPVRFDVALVDGQGRIAIRENVLAA